MADMASQFFKDDPPHGLAKRIMYKKYVQAYIPKMLNAKHPRTAGPMFQKVRIFDGFAGAGRYERYGWSEEIEKYGSPIIALRAVVDYFAANKTSTIYGASFQPCREKDYNCSLGDVAKAEGNMISCNDFEEQDHRVELTFVEGDRSNYLNLVRNVVFVLYMYGLQLNVKQPTNWRYKVVIADCPVACNIIYANFDQMVAPQEPCLAFIDPFGYCQTPMRRIQDFVGEHREVLINLMSSYVNRFVSVNPAQVAELFGIDMEPTNDAAVEALREKIPSRGYDPIDSCLEFYEERLKQAGTNYVISFEMRRKNNTRIYHLVFATNHIKGIIAMKESMNRVTQEPERMVVSDYMILKKNIPFQLSNDQIIDDVADVIFKRFQGKQGVPIGDIERFVWLDTPFVYRKSPLGMLENAKKIHVEPKHIIRQKTTNSVVTRDSRPGTEWYTCKSFPDDVPWKLTFEG